MTIGPLITRLRKAEERVTPDEEGPIALVSHRAIYEGDEIPEGATLYATEAEAIEAFTERRAGSRPVIAIGIADFSINAGEPIGWVSESTTDPDRASVIVHDDIPRRNR
ncbi:hypothetical protein [Methanocalculus sp.]|uniref:hypothetical protein n=1 Tax=Methanocalculus sp. TaxID=2004547 RepID=UPI0026098AE3|nr:hypothetical protein [Methanocalculus sp.]MDG6250824.1 hypothetical protein [Methanocalculus sp.]